MITKEESEKKLSELRESIKGIGKTDYPFTHKDYSLETAIPCTDFSEWINKMYFEKDFWAIKFLKWELFKGAKVLVFGANDDSNLPKEENIRFQNICIDINYILSYNLKDYFDTDDYSIGELFCLLLLSQVLPTTIINYYLYAPDEYNYNIGFNKFCDALSCSSIKPKLDVINNKLLEAEIAKQNYYKNRNVNYEINENNKLQLDYTLIESNNLFNILTKLPISHRLHFWDLINSSYIEDNIRVNKRENLDCWHRTIEYGINPEMSKKSLIGNNLLKPITEIKIILNKLKKDEIVNICGKYNLENKKNESKSSLINKILNLSDKESDLNKIVEHKQLFMFDKMIENDLLRLTEYKNQFKKILEVLFLIEFGKPYRPFTTVKDETGVYLIYRDDKNKHPLIL